MQKAQAVARTNILGVTGEGQEILVAIIVGLNHSLALLIVTLIAPLFSVRPQNHNRFDALGFGGADQQ